MNRFPLNPRMWRDVFFEPADSESPNRPILGYRFNQLWVTSNHPEADQVKAALSLVSPYNGYIWRRGTNMAACHGLAPRRGRAPMARLSPIPSAHTPPGAGCTCGFYACHTLGLVERPDIPRWVADPASGDRYPFAVLVGVAAMGTVRIHEFGWRAEAARVVAICSDQPAITSWMADALAAAYDIPLVGRAEMPSTMQSAGRFWR